MARVTQAQPRSTQWLSSFSAECVLSLVPPPAKAVLALSLAEGLPIGRRVPVFNQEMLVVEGGLAKERVHVAFRAGVCVRHAKTSQSPLPCPLLPQERVQRFPPLS